MSSLIEENKLINNYNSEDFEFLPDSAKTCLYSQLNLDEIYEKGRQDMLSSLSKALNLELGIILPADTFSNFIHKLGCILVEGPCLSKSHLVECELNDLAKLWKNLEKIINFAEQGSLTISRIKLKNLIIELNLTESKFLAAEKHEIAKKMSFFHSFDSKTLENETISLLQQEIKDLKFKLSLPLNFLEIEKVFTSDYFSFQNTDKNSVPSPAKSGLSFDITLQKFQKQQEKLLQEKEWEKQEVQNLKHLLQIKKQKQRKKKSELLDFSKTLKKKSISLEKEKEEIERLKDSLLIERKRLGLLMENKLKKISEFLSEISMNFDSDYARSSPIIEIDRVSDISSIAGSDTSFENESQENDIQYLQQKLKDIEAIYQKDPMESLKFEIEGLKTQIVKLRSYAAINTSITNQKKFDMASWNSRNLLNETNFYYKRSILPKSVITPKSKIMSPVLEYSRNSKVFAFTPKIESQRLGFEDTFRMKDEENTLKEFFKAKELKLQEKEDEIDKEREKIMKNWMKLPMANELIPMVQKEILELRALKTKLRLKMSDCEKKEIEYLAKIEKINKDNQEIIEKTNEIQLFQEKIHDEKLIFIAKLQKLKEEIEKT